MTDSAPPDGDPDPKGRGSRRRRVRPQREEALKAYHTLARHIVGTEDLHYGYWPEGLEVTVPNVPRAQEHHSKLIVDHIPKGTSTILDVGMGAGALSARLKGEGYSVEGVSPSPYLAGEARRRLGKDFHIFECRFEEVETDRRYDLVLFSESFQYIRPEPGLEKCAALIRDGGHLLICDFFRRDVEGDGPLNKGTRLSLFRELIAKHPFEQVEDIDITAETAPTMELAHRILEEAIHPLWKTSRDRFREKRPWLSRLALWVFGKKIRKMEDRYLGDAWSKESFERFKTYRLMVYRKTGRDAQ